MIPVISIQVFASALYSASANDLEIIVCFLRSQETKDELRIIQYPVNDLLLVGISSPICIIECNEFERRGREHNALAKEPFKYFTSYKVAFVVALVEGIG